VEARQRVQLTSTNSSIGLIYALKKFLDWIFFKLKLYLSLLLNNII
jgi:hypothetical protein